MTSESLPSAGVAYPDYLPWRPIDARPALEWPRGARLAVSVVVHVEHLEWMAPDLGVVPPSAARRPPYPKNVDPHEITPHEYGNRVGFFRLRDTLAAFGITAGLALDAASALRYRPIVDAARESDWEFIAHGLIGSRLQTGALPEDEERRIISACMDVMERTAGVRPAGWAGIEYSESPRTVELLAEAGLSYTLDWANDEQPYFMPTAKGTLTAIPISLELDDVYSIQMRRIPTSSWSRMAVQAVDYLTGSEQRGGRLLVLNLHSWIAGQPFRNRCLREVLSAIADREDIWLGTPGEVDRHFRRWAGKES